MKIVTAAEMRGIDARSWQEFGVASLTLMENAGTAVAEFCLREYPCAESIGVICGKGNNGGDGLVAARKLHEAGKSVCVVLLASMEEMKGDAAEMLKRLPVRPVMARNEEELQGAATQQAYESDVLLDAILGTGFKPPLSAHYASAVGRLNAAAGRVAVVAVDIASGTDADEIDGIRSASDAGVVTFTALKPAQVFAAPGTRTVVAPIGTPAAALPPGPGLSAVTAGNFVEFLDGHFPWREADAHKGDFGHVLIIGGCLGKSGAAAMAGMAALRAGAGLVTVACPRSVLPMVASSAPELMTEALEETPDGSISPAALKNGRLHEILRGKDAVAIGPGLGRNAETAEFAREAVRECPHPLALDADGLNAFEAMVSGLEGSRRPLVLTPHPGEFSRLTGIPVAELGSNAARILHAREFAKKCRSIVVLKGHRTLIADPGGEIYVNTTGNAGMATGGTGDVLTGIITTLMARRAANGNGIRAAEAAALGVYLHGLAGDVAMGERGQDAMIATDLIAALPGAFRRIARGLRMLPEIHQSYWAFAGPDERRGMAWTTEA
ncbi:MAG: NAD(P)H-hydrate dehydratase [Acidobacteria bacterium]|nr:NAD(P)H-hydrate dehydratase [Acidobacteriota bacterium]